MNKDQQIKDYEEALKFYAYKGNYEKSLFGNMEAVHIELDKGEHAREVLNKYKS